MIESSNDIVFKLVVAELQRLQKKIEELEVEIEMKDSEIASLKIRTKPAPQYKLDEIDFDYHLNKPYK